MTRTRTVLVAVVLLVAVGAVLSVVLVFDEDPSTGSSGHGDLTVRAPPVEENATSYTLSGVRVTLLTYYDAPERYDEVMVCVYDEHGDLLEGRNIGRLSTPVGRANVSDIHLRTQPAYVVADHPELRDPAPDFDQQILIWNDGTGRFASGYPDDLPFDFPRSSEPGTCP